MEKQTHTFRSASPADTAEIAEKILAICPNPRIFAIYGGLGAGKTTLVKALCDKLGSVDNVKSPTFAIVNEYQYPEGSIFHFDFYRIKSLDEVYDLGYDEYFFSGEYCFIEWPEKITPLVPDEAVTVKITPVELQSRIIELTFQKQ